MRCIALWTIKGLGYTVFACVFIVVAVVKPAMYVLNTLEDMLEEERT